MNLRFQNKLSSIFLFLFLLGTEFIKAQPAIKDIVKITNPEVSSFIKFIDFPIDAYTGNPSIQVPVYTIKDGTIEIPITLRYNASGITVREEASWVGLGWNLNVGGVITQVAVGDFDIQSYFTGYENNFWTDNTTQEWQYDNSESLLKGGIDNCLSSGGCVEQFLFASMGYMQPDVFYFSFFNYSGKFFIDYRDGSIHQLNKESNLKFTILANNGGWTISTEDGMKLLFSQEISTFDINQQIKSQSFYLTQIVYPSGETVYFQYTGESIYSQPVMYSKFVGVYGKKMSTTKWLSPNTVNDILPQLRQESLVLDLIKTPNFKIDFITSTREDIKSNPDFDDPALKLDAIEVSLLDNANKKRKFIFETSYFQATEPYGSCDTYGSAADIPSLTKRLKLDSFFEEGEGAGKYSFTYNSTQLPKKTSFAVDYWGYFNGKVENCTLIPSYPDLIIDIDKPELYDYGANRAYDYSSCQAGMLTEIKFPTGGSVKYFYEPHVFSGKTIPTVGELLKLPAKMKSIDKYIIDANFNQCPATGYPKDETPYSFTLTKTTKAVIYIHFARGNLPLTQFYRLSAYLWSSPQQWSWNVNASNLNDDEDESLISEEIDLPPGSYGMSVSFPDDFGCMKDNGGANSSCNFSLQEENPAYNEFLNRGYSYGGGLRVAEIQLLDNNTIKKKIKYTYESIENKKINGKLISPLSFMQNRSISYYADNTNGTCGLEQSKSLTELDYSGDNLYTSPYSSLKGNVGYVKVIEQTFDQSNVARNGYKTLYFTPINNSVYQREGLPLIPKVEDGLLYQTDYSDPNGNIKRIEKNNYDINHLHTGWGAFCENTLNRTPYLCVNQLGFTPGFRCDDILNGKSWKTLENYNLLLYPLPCYEIKLKSKEIIEDGITKTESYTYNSIGQMSAQSIINSNGDVTMNVIKRVGDYTGTDKTLMAMKENNWLSAVIQKEHKVNGLTKSNELNSFTQIGTQYFNGENVPVYAINNTQFAPTGSGPNYFYSYNYNGAGQIEQLKEKSNSPTSFFWGYNGAFPIVKVENCTSSVLNEAVLASLPNGFSSIDGLLNSLTGIGDMTTSLNKSLWKSFNINLRSKLSENALITTYTYSPLIGMTSQTDSNGQTTYYEYDSFGRLKLVKDNDGNIIKQYQYHYKDQQ